MRGEKRVRRGTRTLHRWLAMFMVAVLLMGESNLSVLAEERATNAELSEEEAFGAVPMEETEEAGVDSVDDTGAGATEDKGELPDEDDDDENICVCNSRCGEDMVNEDCAICAENYENCDAPESEETEESDDSPEGEEGEEGELPEETEQPEQLIEAEAAEDGVEEVAGSGDERIETYADGAEFEDSSGIKYKVVDDGQVEVIGHKDETSVSGTLVIPATIEYGGIRYSVTGIGNLAFKECSSLAGIEIPNSVISIGYSAFENCYALNGIEIPDSVTSIGYSAFQYCDGLTSIEIPDGVASIEGATFWNCRNLISIEIPDSVTSIGISAFAGCNSLTSIEIPDSVTRIGDCAFIGCSSLTSIEIPNGVTRIESDTFQRCRNLISIEIPDSVTWIGFGAFWDCSSLTSIEIPDGVTEINHRAFCGCSSLSSIEIPDGVTSIGDYAFRKCSSLTSIKIPNSITSIGYEAFWDCEELRILRIVVLSDETSISLPKVYIREGKNSFYGTHEDRYIVFVSEDGSPLTGSAFEAAKAAFKADARDGDDTDDLWWGWKLGESDGSEITIKVKKDNSDWIEHKREFGLKPVTNLNAELITDFTSVPDGQYQIYDITDAADGTSGVDTGEIITVNSGVGEATIDYYTVTFYDGDTAYAAGTPQAPQIVLSGKKAKEPGKPSKEGYTFSQWVTTNNGSEIFNFDTLIENTSKIYASWISNNATKYYIEASAGEGGSITPEGRKEVQEGGTLTFEITPNNGYRIKAVTVDGIDRTDDLTDSISARAINTQAETSRYYTFIDIRGSHSISAAFETENGGGNTGDGGDTGTGGDNGDSGDNGTGGSSGDGGDTETGGSGGDSDNIDKDDNGVINISNVDNVESVGSSSAENSNRSTNGGNNVSSNNNTANPTKDAEPKTGDSDQVEIYATVAMIAGLTYLLLYFADKERGMTEEEKQELVSSMIRWAKRGSCIKKYIVLVPIFILLCYYHSIGKRVDVEREEVPV